MTPYQTTTLIYIYIWYNFTLEIPNHINRIIWKVEIFFTKLFIYFCRCCHKTYNIMVKMLPNQQQNFQTYTLEYILLLFFFLIFQSFFHETMIYTPIKLKRYYYKHTLQFPLTTHFCMHNSLINKSFSFLLKKRYYILHLYQGFV